MPNPLAELPRRFTDRLASRIPGEDGARKSSLVKVANLGLATKMLCQGSCKLGVEMPIGYAAVTNRGLVRERNEDNFLVAKLRQVSAARDGSSAAIAGIAQRNEVLLLLVADGMGGESRGDLASQIVVERFTQCVANLCGPVVTASSSAEATREFLHRELKRCHADLRRKANTYPELRGMGSTATVAVVAWPKLFVAHVGDSRCYLVRSGKAQQLTKDHSLAQYLVDQGAMNASLRNISPLRHQLWNALGGDADDLTVDFHDVDLKDHDSLLLCTDGLTNRLSNVQLADRLGANIGAAEICGGLVTAANAAGGQDNVTCCVVRFAADISPLTVSSSCQSFASQADLQSESCR